ncbi:MAG: sensor histidine kinase [Chloroflexota bacterium]
MKLLRKFANKDDIWLSLTGVVLVVAVSSVGISNASTMIQIWVILGLMLLFSLTYAAMPQPNPGLSPTPKRAYICLTILTVIAGVASLFLSTAFTVLFFVVSVNAMMLLPIRQALGWIAIFTVISAVAYVSREGLISGGLSALINGTGFIFFGAFGQALLRAETAKRESQKLLAELQTAHQQLQAYAEQVETLAVAEERNRLSRDLHDTLGHRLTVSLVQLEGAERLVSREPERAADIIHTVREQLNDGLGEVRQTVAMLRTPLSTDISLPKALRQLAHNFEAATQLNIDTHLPDTLSPLPERYRLALYRAAQEALTNVQRHAQAQTATLSLEVTAETLILTIQDDGIGISDVSDTGFGLRGMQERAKNLGGELLILGGEESGTTLKFSLPNHPNIDTPTSANGTHHHSESAYESSKKYSHSTG